MARGARELKRYQVIVLAAVVVVAFGGTIWLLVQPGDPPGLDPDDPTHLPQLVGVAPERLGDLVGELYTGFDVYRHTPSFSARGAASRASSAELAEVRGAMCYLVVLFRRHAEFQPDGIPRTLKVWGRKHVPVGWRFVITGYEDLRALSRAQAGMLKGSLKAVAEVLAEQGAASTGSGSAASEAAQFRRMREVMIEGAPCRVALRRGPGQAPSTGSEQAASSTLVYKITDYELASVLWLYDPDLVYQRGRQTAIKTLVLYDRIEKRFVFFLEGYTRSGKVVALD